MTIPVTGRPDTIGRQVLAHLAGKQAEIRNLVLATSCQTAFNAMGWRRTPAMSND